MTELLEWSIRIEWSLPSQRGQSSVSSRARHSRQRPVELRLSPLGDTMAGSSTSSTWPALTLLLATRRPLEVNISKYKVLRGFEISQNITESPYLHV